MVDPGETCDDGNARDNDACASDCTPSCDLQWSTELMHASMVPPLSWSSLEPAFDIAGAPGGHVVVTARAETDQIDVVTARLSPEGEVLWEAVFDSGAGDDEGNAVAVADDGTVHVVGTASDGAGTSAIALAYDQTGALLASRVVESSVAGTGVAVAGDGGVFASAIADGATGSLLRIDRLDAAGDSTWTWWSEQPMNGGRLAAGSSMLYALTAPAEAEPGPYAVVVLGLDGRTMSSIDLEMDTSRDIELVDVAVGGDGRVLATVATHAEHGVPHAATIVALEPDGTVAWTRDMDSLGLEPTRAFTAGLAVDADGNVVVAGTLHYPEDVRVWFARLDPEGVPLCGDVFGDGDTHIAGGVSVDEGGRILLTGERLGSEGRTFVAAFR